MMVRIGRRGSGRIGRALWAAAMLVLLLGEASCLGGGRRNEPVRYWVLDALPGPPERAANTRILGVGPVDLPALLERPGIVTREGENRILVASLDQWGEPLDRGFKRVLSENLSILDPQLKIVTFPWSGPVAPELQLAMVVDRLDARLGESVELRASWAITRTEDRREIAIDSTWIREPATEDGVKGVVAAMSRALETLSRQLAPAIDGAFATANAETAGRDAEATD